MKVKLILSLAAATTLTSFSPLQAEENDQSASGSSLTRGSDVKRERNSATFSGNQQRHSTQERESSVRDPVDEPRARFEGDSTSSDDARCKGMNCPGSSSRTVTGDDPETGLGGQTSTSGGESSDVGSVRRNEGSTSGLGGTTTGSIGGSPGM